jgi:hypothetical protein
MVHYGSEAVAGAVKTWLEESLIFSLMGVLRCGELANHHDRLFVSFLALGLGELNGFCSLQCPTSEYPRIHSPLRISYRHAW